MNIQEEAKTTTTERICAIAPEVFGLHGRLQTSVASGLLLLLALFALLPISVAFAQGERFLGARVGYATQGVVVLEIEEGSPATRVVDGASGHSMSLESGDIIQVVNGVTVSSPAHFVHLIRSGPPVALIRVWDGRNRVVRNVGAAVGPPNEVEAYMNQFANQNNSSPDAETPPQSQPIPDALRRARAESLQLQINDLDRKIVELGNKHPGATNMMLQNSGRRLLRTLQDQKMKLERLKAKLEAGN